MFLDRYIDSGWTLAVRKNIPDGQLFQSDDKRPFYAIKNPWRYWCADPFLFNYKGTEYIFCEAFDIFKDKGVIAYRIIGKNGKVSKLYPCLECEGHLSYPNIFEHDGQIYMVPESGDANEIALYKAIQFPDKWEKAAVLVKDVAACDTNLIRYNNETYLLTVIIDKNQSQYSYDSLYLYVLNGDCFEKCENSVAVCDAEYARNGGNMFYDKEYLYRVSQNCKDMYGENLNFLAVDKISSTHYEEHLTKKVSLSDIEVAGNKRYDGIHTYNFDLQYEIIDLQKKKWFRIERFLYLVMNKFKHNTIQR